MPEWYDVLPERDLSLSSRWPTEEFRDELRAWCESHVGPLPTMEQHKLRGWATVWRVTTADGCWFAKQNCPGQIFEQPLMAVAGAARTRPRRTRRGARATASCSPPTRGRCSSRRPGDDLENWVRLAREAALLQRELVPHVAELRGRRADRR